MDTQGLKEQEAFRKIQQLSMNSRKSLYIPIRPYNQVPHVQDISPRALW